METNFFQPNSICKLGDRVFFIHGNFIYMIAGGVISLYAGSLSGANIDNLTNRLHINLAPWSLACGNNAVYASSHEFCRIYQFGDDGSVAVIAGKTKVCQTTADGRSAQGSPINQAWGLAILPSGELAFAEGSGTIRKIAKDGSLQTIAGSGVIAYTGDGGPALLASFVAPDALLADKAGNLYVVDRGANVVRKISAKGTISTVAGTGVPRDQTPSNNLALANPWSLALGKDGSLYIGEFYRGIRKLSPQGLLTSFISAGDDIADSVSTVTMSNSFAPSDLSALGHRPGFTGIFMQDDGTFLVGGPKGILLYSADGSKVSDYVGGNRDVACNQTVSAGRRRFYEGGAIAYTPDNQLLVADWKAIDSNQLAIFAIAKSNGDVISHGLYGCTDNPFLASQNYSLAWRQFTNGIGSMVTAKDGTTYFASIQRNLVLKIDTKGVITPFAGTGRGESSGDGSLASTASIKNPFGLALGGDGSLYVAETGGWADMNAKIRKINPAGIITTVVGTGDPGDDGEGGPAKNAHIRAVGVAVAPDNRLFIADYHNGKIKMVDSAGLIHTIAGGGTLISNDDKIDATNIDIGLPSSIAVTNDGTVYFVNDLVAVKELRQGADGRWVMSTVIGNNNTRGDCGTGRQIGLTAAKAGEETIKNSLTVICEGLPRTVTVKDTCPAQGGDTRIAISQSFNGFVNFVEIIKPCAP